MITIRTASESDADEIARVHVASWKKAYRGLVPDRLLDDLDEVARGESWRQTLRGGSGAAMVLLRDRRIVGFSYFSRSRDHDAANTIGEVQAIYIHPSHWRLGFGQRLMDETMAQLRKEGYEQVTLWVLAGNMPARRFYETLGFDLDGTQTEHAATGLLELRYVKSLAE